MNSLAILRDTFVNFGPSLYQLVNTITLIKTLGILQGTFGNFRPLSLTPSACVNLHLNLPLPTSNARYREHLKAFTNLGTL